MSVARQRAYLEREIQRAREQLDALDQLPQLDVFEHGTIVRCVVDDGGREFTYVFLKITEALQLNGVTDRWYFTGQINAQGVGPYRRWATWEALVGWLVNRGRHVVSWDVVWPVTAVIEYADGRKISVPMPQPHPESYDYKTEGLGGT